MSETTGARLLARQLAAEGIDTVFGVFAAPMVDAIVSLPKEGIRFIGCRHEEQAGFMAQAWGYTSRKPGIVIAGTGPGTTNTIPSMFVAQSNGWPLVVLGGSAPSAEVGTGSFQEGSQVAMAAPSCKWHIQVPQATRIPELLHMALGKACAGRPGAVYVDFPAQTIKQKTAVELLVECSAAPRVYPPRADAAGVEAVAQMLAEAERPVILVGKGAGWADAGMALAELVNVGVPFVASPMGRGTVPDDSPLNVGAARTFALQNADAVLMVGGRFNWMFSSYHRMRENRPRPCIAQIDICPEEMHMGVNVDIGLVADCASACADIAQALYGQRLRSATTEWALQARQQADAKREDIEHRMAAADSVPISMLGLFREVRAVLNRDAVIVLDGDVTMATGRMVLPSYFPRHQLNAGTTGCMGVGVPYAIGAKVARPKQQVVAVIGDYAFGASAMEVETAARNGIDVTFVVANNSGINGRTLQDRFIGQDGPPIASLLPARYEQLAQMVGGHFENVQRPEELLPALRRAISAGKVSVVNVMVDPVDNKTKRTQGYLGGGYAIASNE